MPRNYDFSILYVTDPTLSRQINPETISLGNHRYDLSLYLTADCVGPWAYLSQIYVGTLRAENLVEV